MKLTVWDVTGRIWETNDVTHEEILEEMQAENPLVTMETVHHDLDQMEEMFRDFTELHHITLKDKDVGDVILNPKNIVAVKVER